MAHLHSTEPMSLLLLHHLHRPSSPLVAAFAAATMRARAGTLCPDDAHQLLDELLHQATPVPEHKHPLNDFLAALAGGAVHRSHLPSASPQPSAILPRPLSQDGLAANALIGRCRAMSSSSPTSPTLRVWSPIAAFSAATASVHKGTLSAEDAHHMFDKLLRQATPVPGRFLNAFLAALARAPPSDACRDGPALALALFNRVCREEEEGLQVAPLSGHTYNILMDCCCRARRPDLGLAIFGLFLRTGMKTNPIIVSTFLKCLCYAKRTDEAVDVLLRRMPDLGCAPNTFFSYNIVAKGLCDDGRSQQALDLLQMVVKQGGTCSLGVVSYTTVIDGFLKEGQVSKACNLFHGMKQQRVMPNVVTYTSIIGALFKARAVDKAELFLRQMLHDGVQPNKLTYNIMIHGYSSLGQWKEASKMLKEMKSQGLTLNIATWNSLITSLHKHGRSHEAAGVFHSITAKCQEPQA
ncbi:hypothetical protein QYE76_009326 [Lolium multiflorum]|uniref:Pentatricopeptide repeat-containing protein n=1 Tax=Lolium multiflorum TaxID=4521 RepID=A0AAD8X3H0_LOLMU|nr:hypothetical protein QYE76_009326 [Lolium multiflorum]